MLNAVATKRMIATTMKTIQRTLELPSFFFSPETLSYSDEKLMATYLSTSAASVRLLLEFSLFSWAIIQLLDITMIPI